MKLGESAQRRQEKWARKMDKRVKRRAAGKKAGLWVESAEDLPLRAIPIIEHPDSSGRNEPRAHQIILSQEQIERFETNKINGMMVIAVIEEEDYLPEEILGTTYPYLTDQDRDRVIVSEAAIAQNIRSIATKAVDITQLNSFESTAQAYGFEGLGVSIPRDRIVDIGTQNFYDENHGDQSSS